MTATMSLSRLKIGQEAILDSFQVSSIHQRLLAMGITPGVSVRVVRVMSGNGNLYVRIGGRNLALRREEADVIFVKNT